MLPQQARPQTTPCLPHALAAEAERQLAALTCWSMRTCDCDDRRDLNHTRFPPNN